MKITDEFVFFWGNDDLLSNFAYSPFVHEGISFQWSEQAIMYRKTKLFGAQKLARKVLEATSPKECKKLGRSRSLPFDEDVWNDHKESLFEEVLFDKFSVPEYRKQLLDTGDKTLVEASPYDKVWGIGLTEDHPDAENPDKWLGQNLLGIVLERVRTRLREEDQ